MSGRFDTMLATAMRLADGDPGARRAAWRQVVDIVAQAGDRLEPDARAGAFGRLAALRDDVPVADRRMAAASLAGRTRDPLIAALFAQDVPAVAAPFLTRAELDDADWQRVIPVMAAASRNLLRNRRDLSGVTNAALAQFAAADLTLPRSDARPAVDVVQPGVTQIRELVDRIAAYRQRVPVPQAESAPDTPEASAQDFMFETDIEGSIDWVEGVAREAVIGTSVAEAATLGVAGVDGQAAGAWRRRAPFRDARLVIAGTGQAGGDWLISAAPLFNPHDGRFCGYRGSARRPRADERAEGKSAGFGRSGGIAPDSLRQLVHELRTPLNAIQGFAEMIDRQMLGPAALRYRERARAIMGDAERLVAMVDDLDTSARLDSGRLTVDRDDADLVAIVQRCVAQQHGPLAARDVTLAFDVSASVGLVGAGAALVERMALRLIAAASAVATPGERIEVAVAQRGADIALTVARPHQLAGRESELLDPGYGPDGDWPDAPLLGLGFTLRLVARLAAQVGGRLAILPERFVLALPPVAARAEVRPRLILARDALCASGSAAAEGL